MNAHQLRVKRAILAALSPLERRAARFAHIYPCGYVVARWPASLVVALPGFDDRMPAGLRRTGTSVDRFFGQPLVGDWVSLAYVVLPGSSQFIAVELVK